MSNATVQRQYDFLILGDGADGFFDMNPDNLHINNNVLVIAKVTSDEQRLANNERRHALIGNNVVLGSGCTIIGSVIIGDDCIIGARAIVTHDVPPNSVVIGTNQIRPKREDESAPPYSNGD